MTTANIMRTLEIEEQLQLVDALHLVLTFVYGTPPLYCSTTLRVPR